MAARTQFDLILFSNFEGLDTSRPANVVRIPLVYALASAMTGWGKILVVTHYVSPATTLWRQPGRFRRHARAPSAHMLTDNLWVYTPFTPFNLALAEMLPGALRFLRRRLGGSLRQTVASLGFEDSSKRVVWLSHPFHLYYLGLLREDLVIYHCADDFALLGRSSPDTHVSELEKALARRSNLVLTSARTLQHRLVVYNQYTHYFPNAVDFTHFHQAADPSADIPQELKGIPPPIIGFMGNLTDWYDYDLLGHVIARGADWSFVFLGQAADNVRDRVDLLATYPNVHLLGWKDYYGLPAYLRGFDVAMLPYEVNEFTRSVNPNKLYQFMAAGIPVVATPIREACRFGDVIELAEGADGFRSAIQRSLGQRASRRVRRGISIAQRESWEERARMAVDLLADRLLCKPEMGLEG